jgi:hypothetical protein
MWLCTATWKLCGKVCVGLVINILSSSGASLDMPLGLTPQGTCIQVDLTAHRVAHSSRQAGQ